jgi:DNA-binding transcriptional ArsR family regulator
MIDQKLDTEIGMLHNRICSALADPKRILILYLLAESPRLVNELAEMLQIPQPTVSRHLAVLRERGLVSTEREGTAIRYTLGDHRIIEALDLMRAILNTQLTNSIELAKSLIE